MKTVDLSKVPEFLQEQRWFAGKAWPIKTVTVVDHVTLSFPKRNIGEDLAIVEVTYELGQPERYLLPVKPGPGGAVREALEDDSFARALFEIIREQQHCTSAAGAVRGMRISSEHVGLLDRIEEKPKVRRLGVEQSNTSFVFDELAIMKVIRKLEPGLNPELEIGRFLMERTKFRATPPLLGALTLEGPAEATLALVHEFVPAKGDGWTYTLEAFRSSTIPEAAFLAEVRELGARVGELHVALASDPEDPAFAPEPVQTEDLQRWSSSLIGEMGVTLADASKLAPKLFDRRENLVERARRFAQLEPGGQKIRVHGDLHLGQVLRGPKGWLIIDFEGEPARSFSSRREKYLPLKDVAGMLRSFAYADAVIEREGGEPGHRVKPTREAFLDGYLSATRGAAFLPSNRETLHGMLEAMEMEKLLYEVRYELQSRPEWVEIPMKALIAMEEAR